MKLKTELWLLSIALIYWISVLIWGYYIIAVRLTEDKLFIWALGAGTIVFISRLGDFIKVSKRIKALRNKK
jgi:membrane-associated protease RseP (regulator of RpoE activity)